jgi:hypothetical protein
MKRLLTIITIFFALLLILLVFARANGLFIVARFADGGDEQKLLGIEITPTPSPTPEPTPTPTPTPTTTPTPKPMSAEVQALLGRNAQVAEEMESRNYMAGRLLIQSVGIDVALFTDGEGTDEAEIRQAICDAYDSAALFTDGVAEYIADHNNQAFSTLNNIQVGDMAYILRGHSIVTAKCTIKMDGHNYGNGILDLNDETVAYLADFFCYTCEDNWNNINILGFDIVDVDFTY